MQIERLESNWYSTAADVVSMSEVGMRTVAALPHLLLSLCTLSYAMFSIVVTSPLLRLIVHSAHPMSDLKSKQKYAVCCVHMHRMSMWWLTLLRCSQAEAQSLRIPMRLLTVLKESLQAALPANGTASMQSLASSGLPQQLSLELNALPESLPGIKAEPKATRRRSATKAAQLLEAAQRQQQQQSSSASDPQLNGSSRSVRTMEKAHLSGLHTPAESIFHGPVKPLRAAEELQSSSAANLNGAHSQQQLETEQAFEAPQTVLESSGSKAQALLEQASGAGTAEAAVEQEAAEVATCAEALSIALSGEPPAVSEDSEQHADH